MEIVMILTSTPLFSLQFLFHNMPFGAAYTALF